MSSFPKKNIKPATHFVCSMTSLCSLSVSTSLLLTALTDVRVSRLSASPAEPADPAVKAEEGRRRIELVEERRLAADMPGGSRLELRRRPTWVRLRVLEDGKLIFD